MNKCCACGGAINKAAVSGWKVFFVSTAMLFPLGIALYSFTKWLEIKAKVKKEKGNFKETLELKSELLKLENMLKEANKGETNENGGKGDGTADIQRSLLNLND